MSYFDRDGNPMTMEEWAKTFGDREYKVVKQTAVGDKRISTVWLGLDHNYFDEGDGPIIFETMVFPEEGYDDLYMERYKTEEEAIAGHNHVHAEIERNGGKDILYEGV